MTTVATRTAPPAQAHPARTKALEAFTTRLREWNRAQAGREQLERQARITIGQRTVELEPWERQQLNDWFAEAEPATPAGRYLLAHGAALMLKSSYDIERLQRGNDGAATEMYALQAELMLDTAIGMAVLKDLQRAIEGLVKEGSFDSAKGLTQFRHRLAHVVNDAKMCIAESEQRQAEEIAISLSDHPEPQATEASATPAPAPVAAAVQPAGSPPASAQPASPAATPAQTAATTNDPKPKPIDYAAKALDVPTIGMADPTVIAVTPEGRPVAPMRRREQTRRPRSASAPSTTSGASSSGAATSSAPSSTGVLFVLALLTGLVWFGWTQVPAIVRGEQTVLTRGNFADLPIVAVESRAPSVYLTVPADKWSLRESRGQEQLIQQLGRTAQRHGFTGLLLRDDAGTTVAAWLSRRGAFVIDHREDGQAVRLPPEEEPGAVLRPVGPPQQR